jgi:cell wall-associated NlpC family hydrolase
MTGVAAVQARIAQIQGQFAVPSVVRAPSTSPAPGAAPAPGLSHSSAGSFAAALAAQTSQLGGASATGAPTASAPGSSGGPGELALAAARQHVGTPYVWGGNSPGGFDCSGLMQWSYRQVGIELPRVSTDQAKVGTAVSADAARPGDLVFFERGAVDHIGMYAGNGQWLVAPKKGDVVKLQDVDLSAATTIRRVADSSAAAAGAIPYAAASPAPASFAGAGTGEAAFSSLFASVGAARGVSPALLGAIARAESGFNPTARSSAGAQGLMQLMPATAQGLGVDPMNPAEAVDGAARLLKQHLSRFGSTELALAAYNAGPGAVLQHGGVPPYRETQDYVAKIMRELRGVPV